MSVNRDRSKISTSKAEDEGALTCMASRVQILALVWNRVAFGLNSFQDKSAIIITHLPAQENV